MAFTYAGRLTPGDVLQVERARMEDGTQPIAGEVMRCGTCWAALTAREGVLQMMDWEGEE